MVMPGSILSDTHNLVPSASTEADSIAVKTLASTGMDMAFVQISAFHDDLSLAYLIPSDEAADEVLKTAFGDRATFDGTSYVLKPGISRKKEMVPAITDVLEASPKG